MAVVSLLLHCGTAAALAGATPPYMDPGLPPEHRAKDLVSRLSLEQQVGLLLSSSDRSGGVSSSDIAGCSAGSGCANITDYKWWTECTSGIEVEYPQNVNIAATFNRSLAFLAGRGTGVGLRKRADAQPQDVSCWSPMANIMRHPLWGRGHEGYGECPYLAGEMVYQNVLGVQGYGLEGYPKFSLANTGCKHFSTFNGPMNWGTAVISDYDWFLNYLPQFEKCIEAGSYSVMCSYASLNGVSGCADSRAMQTVLRDKWGLRASSPSHRHHIARHARLLLLVLLLPLLILLLIVSISEDYCSLCYSNLQVDLWYRTAVRSRATQRGPSRRWRQARTSSATLGARASTQP